MNTVVLTFTPSGSGSCLYTELIDLQQIGPLQVDRATTVEFNGEEQVWEVRSLIDELLFSNRSRAICLAWEQQHFSR